MKGTPVKNPKLLKQGLKLSVGLIGSVVIGVIIKLEKKIDARIDERFADPKPESEEDN